MLHQQSLQYDTTCIIYTNSDEYCAALRQFYHINPVFQITESVDFEIEDETKDEIEDETKDEIEDETKDEIEDETKDEIEDELLYDTTISMSMIAKIYEITKNNLIFMDLYKKAASRIFSDDEIMGLTLLFCYDQFSTFVPILVDYWNGNHGDVLIKYHNLYNSV